MAKLLLIASLFGFRGASGLAAPGNTIWMGRTTKSLSRDASGREFFMHAGVHIYPHMVDGERIPSLDGMGSSHADAEKHWMVMLQSDAKDVEAALMLHEFTPARAMTHPDLGEVPILSGMLTDGELRELIDRFPGRIIASEEDPYVQRVHEELYDTGVERRRSFPWGIQDINADVVRGRGVGVNVYVLDTGIRTTHSQYGGRAFAGVDMTSSSLVVCAPGSTTCARDYHGHGTHCAGTVGSTAYGVANGASLWAMKVLDDAGNGYVSWSVDAEQWVLSSGLRPALLSMSLGGSGQSTAEKNSIDSLVADGVMVVVAAGNNNADACFYNPAWIPSAITVGSYALGGLRSGFSNYGTCLDVWAPGSDILSSCASSDTNACTSSGTSMACPHVSGLAAIMYEAYPTAGSMTASQRWALLTASQRTGYVTGIPALPASVNLVALAPTSSPTPSPTAVSVDAKGDPHLTNVHGEKFDLMASGKHLLIRIPRTRAEKALLRVDAEAQRFGGQCADIYFQDMNITGAWADAKQTGGFRYQAAENHAKRAHWVKLGPMQLKVAHGHTQTGVTYLNIYVKNLERAGYAIGGLLGEDDHSVAEKTPEACAQRMAL